jgi:hypothetical protein
VSETVGLFIIGLILGLGIGSFFTVLAMTWWAKDDWLEGYKAGLDSAASLLRRLGR